MELELLSLVIPSFIAGILTFLAPCTLPLVPGYLGFISGVSVDDLKDPEKSHGARRKIFMNGLLYVIGFSVVFIMLGSLVGLGGSALVQHRVLLGRIGGAFIIIFGLYMLNVLKLNFLNFLGGEHRIPIMNKLKPGTPLSSLIFGSTFALGWTPCVGPILGSVLVLAASSATVGQGTVLLAVFSPAVCWCQTVPSEDVRVELLRIIENTLVAKEALLDAEEAYGRLICYASRNPSLDEWLYPLTSLLRGGPSRPIRTPSAGGTPTPSPVTSRRTLKWGGTSPRKNGAP